jgi:hypothetical protein
MRKDATLQNVQVSLKNGAKILLFEQKTLSLQQKTLECI